MTYIYVEITDKSTDTKKEIKWHEPKFNYSADMLEDYIYQTLNYDEYNVIDKTLQEAGFEYCNKSYNQVIVENDNFYIVAKPLIEDKNHGK